MQPQVQVQVPVPALARILAQALVRADEEVVGESLRVVVEGELEGQSMKRSIH